MGKLKGLLAGIMPAIATLPDSNKQAPNKRQKKIGPARSASSKICSPIV